jgi:hypothetical protein
VALVANQTAPATGIAEAAALPDVLRLRLSIKWPDEVRMSDLEPRFICLACGKRGADVRPDFNWNAPSKSAMARLD